MKQVTIFASGSGTNAENIIKFFHDNNFIKVIQVLTNNKNAKVIERCKLLNVKCLTFNKTEFYTTEKILNHLKETTDFIVLAGFLWKIPMNIIHQFPNKILNIHPALLPKYGGKGMYGMHIHRAVVQNNENKSGITIHYVNENYDEGAIIFQKSFVINESDDENDVAKKVAVLEMENFPKVIESVILNLS